MMRNVEMALDSLTERTRLEVKLFRRGGLDGNDDLLGCIVRAGGHDSASSNEPVRGSQ
jgi:hypothetical protein